MQVAITVKPSGVTRSVKACAGNERIVEERLAIEFWMLEVATGNSASTNADFTPFPDGQGVQVGVQDVDSCVVDATADWQRLLD